jgi:hypothetical protein
LQQAEDNAGPDDGTEMLDNDIFEPPFKVQLTHMHELSEIWFA